MKICTTLLTLTTAALSLVGCAGYQLGSAVPQNLRSIFVSSFENNTVYPMVGASVTQHAMTAIVHDGTFTLDPLNKATLRMTGSVDGITTKAISYDQSNATLPDEYLVGIKAKIYVYNTLTGEMLINGKTVQASTYMLTRGEMQTAVVDIIPTLSAKLSENILTQLHNLDNAPIKEKAPVKEEEIPVKEEETPEIAEEPFQPTIIDPNAIYPTPNPICSCERGTIYKPETPAEETPAVEEAPAPVVEAPVVEVEAETPEIEPPAQEDISYDLAPAVDPEALITPPPEEPPAVEPVEETPVIDETPPVEPPVETPAIEEAPEVEEKAPEAKPEAPKTPDQLLMEQLLITE